MAEGKLHIYHPQRGLLLFEHTHPLTSKATTTPPHILLFIGGMYDNFLAPSYTRSLASLLSHSRQWRFIHVQLSSAGRSFGTSSLSKDVSELGIAIAYIRTHLTPQSQSKVVLMGHSTGTQDALSYLFLENQTTKTLFERPKVDGVILQAAASDRDVATPYPPTASLDRVQGWEACLAFARSAPKHQKRTTILPLHLTSSFFGVAPLSVERFWSLASPDSPEKPEEDDMFSQDVSDVRLRETFGVALASGEGVLQPLPDSGKKEILVLQSGSDEYVPEHIDVEKSLDRWRAVAGEVGGRLHEATSIIAHAVHDLRGEDAMRYKGREVDMRRAVWRYLSDIIGNDGGLEEEVEKILKEAEGEARRLGDKANRGNAAEVETEAKI